MLIVSLKRKSLYLSYSQTRCLWCLTFLVQHCRQGKVQKTPKIPQSKGKIRGEEKQDGKYKVEE